MVDCATRILKEEGPTAFYKGTLHSQSLVAKRLVGPRSIPDQARGVVAALSESPE